MALRGNKALRARFLVPCILASDWDRDWDRDWDLDRDIDRDREWDRERDRDRDRYRRGILFQYIRKNV
jgi:hypothetical protein